MLHILLLSGNLNISILTSYRKHDRKRNLRMIAEALNQEFNIKVVFFFETVIDERDYEFRKSSKQELMKS